MTTPQGHTGPTPPALSAEQLRAQVAALAEQVRALGNGYAPAYNGPPSLAGEPTGAAEHEAPGPPSGEESLTERSSRLLAGVIAMADLAAAEIRASAEREAADIRERASAAIREADEALERYRQALEGLAGETEHVERAITGLREQAHALDEERRAIEAALRAVRDRR
jgi:hypothetical protein